MRVNRISWVGLVLVLLGRAELRAGELVLVEAGAARCQVLVRPDAGVWERRGAEDLVGYIEQMSGAKVLLVDEEMEIEAALKSEGRLVLVGQLALDKRPALAAALAAAAKPDPVLRADGIAVQRRGDQVYLAGTNDESHYYAVVELLEYWGCRWYLPGPFGACIPRRERLAVDQLEKVYAPPFEVRRYWLSWYGAPKGRPEFMRRNRMNDLYVPSGHALSAYVEDLVPPGKSAFDICLSSEATAQHVADQVIERFAAGAAAVSLGMDDGIYQSDCASDSLLKVGLWDKYFLVPSLTDAFMTFYNKVARRTKVRFGDRHIGFLAYANITLPPQRDLVAESPLVAYLAPIDICPIHGMDDARCSERQEYRDMMYRWAQVMEGRLVIYDYDQGMLVWRDLPNPSVQALRQDVKHYRRAGILGIDTESRGAMATTFLNLYFRGQLYWNPDRDVVAMLEEFYPKFYGPAAAPMRLYWEGLLETWAKTEVHGHEFMIAPSIYTPDVVEHLAAAVAAGEALLAGRSAEDIFVRRMAFMRLGVEVLQNYLEMVRQGATELDFAAAVAAGQRGLAARQALGAMDPSFTTTRLEEGDPWWTGEVGQFRDLAALVDAGGGLVALPLAWEFKLDPYDRGVVQNWASAPQSWPMLRTDRLMEPQGAVHGDGSDYNGLVWYRTQVELDAGQVQDGLHLRFTGLFGEAWLYLNGALVAHRPWRSLWWYNNYRFEWDVPLGGALRPGTNHLAIRLHNAHGMGGIWRRPFLYRPAPEQAD